MSSHLCLAQTINEIKGFEKPFVDKSLSEQDILETISSFKTNDISKTVSDFKKKMPRPNRDKKTRKLALKKINDEFGKIIVNDFDLKEKIRKLIYPILRFYDREKTYDLIIIKNKTPFIMNQSGVVLVISTGLLLETESDDALLGFIAHEVGHEYFIEYSKYSEHLFVTVKLNGNERALSRHFAHILAILELQCDAFAAITLAHLGYHPTAFAEAAERISGKFPVDPKAYHPSATMRKRVAREVLPKTLNQTGKQKFSPLFKKIRQAVSRSSIHSNDFE